MPSNKHAQCALRINLRQEHVVFSFVFVFKTIPEFSGLNIFSTSLRLSQFLLKILPFDRPWAPTSLSHTLGACQWVYFRSHWCVQWVHFRLWTVQEWTTFGVDTYDVCNEVQCKVMVSWFIRLLAILCTCELTITALQIYLSSSYLGKVSDAIGAYLILPRDLASFLHMTG